jgi:hypothetical protein
MSDIQRLRNALIALHVLQAGLDSAEYPQSVLEGVAISW